jgi:hypothetical protein
LSKRNTSSRELVSVLVHWFRARIKNVNKVLKWSLVLDKINSKNE